jgi:sterol desaturase/sphingolipid hydroxylase (fatty acid hydroxylase superfamily)
MTYDWFAGLVLLAAVFLTTRLGYFLAFKVPALQRMRVINREQDALKMADRRYRPMVKASIRVGLATNVVFFLILAPFVVTLEAVPVWRYLTDLVLILVVFDFFYYLTHRFVFHGKLLRKVHALHHQARTPTYIDALYVHPVETTIGLVLFLGSIPLVAAFTGGPMNAVAMGVATLIFTAVNTINHTYVNLPRFPFKTLDYITSIHAAHHVDMNQGNYATLTMIYDWMFGTLEAPVSRSTP